MRRKRQWQNEKTDIGIYGDLLVELLWSDEHNAINSFQCISPKYGENGELYIENRKEQTNRQT